MDNLLLLLCLGILTTIGVILLLSNNINHTFALTNIISSPQESNYTLYTSDKLGVSFEYPKNWNISEDINRFSTYSSIKISNGSNYFKVVKSQTDSDTKLIKKLGGLKEAVDIILPSGEKVIGTIDQNKYSIDNAGTVSVLTEKIEPGSTDQGTERIFIIHDDVFYILSYGETVDKFDSKNSQDKFNHIIESFKFAGTTDKKVKGD